MPHFFTYVTKKSLNNSVNLLQFARSRSRKPYLFAARQILLFSSAYYHCSTLPLSNLPATLSVFFQELQVIFILQPLQIFSSIAYLGSGYVDDRPSSDNPHISQPRRLASLRPPSVTSFAHLRWTHSVHLPVAASPGKPGSIYIKNKKINSEKSYNRIGPCRHYVNCFS